MESFAKLYSQKLFFTKTTRKISCLEIVRASGVSDRTSKHYIKKDLESGFIKKEVFQHQYRKYKTFLSERNIYTFTDKGQPHLNGSKQESLMLQRLTNQKGEAL